MSLGLLVLASCTSANPDPATGGSDSGTPAAQADVLATFGTCDPDPGDGTLLEIGRSLPVTNGPVDALWAEVFTSQEALDAWEVTAGATVDASSVDFSAESVAVGAYTARDLCTAPILSLQAWDLPAGPYVQLAVQQLDTNCETMCNETDYFLLAQVVPSTGDATVCAIATGFCP